MRYLLDTHTFLWFVHEPEALSRLVLDVMCDGQSTLLWSAASFWEITVKVSLGKIEMADDWQTRLQAEKKRNRILDLPITAEHCVPNIDLPWIHRDPFDRLLISQALAMDLCILTKDHYIRQYPVQTLW